MTQSRTLNLFILSSTFFLSIQLPAYGQRQTSGLTGLDASPAEVQGGDPFSLSVDVNHALDRDAGLAVRFTSDDLAVAPFAPRNAFVLKPLTSLTVSGFPTRAVPVDTTVVLRATAEGRTLEATLLVRAPRIASVDTDRGGFTGGESGTGVVNLTGPAPPTGLLVELASSDPNVVSVPASVIVLPGATGAEFPVATSGVDTIQNVTVTAFYLDSDASEKVEVRPAQVETFTLRPDSVVSGGRAIGVVTLNGLAPPGGTPIEIVLGGADPAPVILPEVVVLEGARQAIFEIDTIAVAVESLVTLRAQVAGQRDSGNARRRTDDLRVTPAVLASLDLAPNAVRGGRNVFGRVSLIGPAGPGGILVALQSSAPEVASVPRAVQIPEGERVVEFTIQTKRVVGRQEVTIGAQAGDTRVFAELVVETPIQCDWDDDGDMDLADIVAFQACFTGAGGQATLPCAAVFDADNDNDVDLADLLDCQQGATKSPVLIRVAVDPEFKAPHPPLPDPNGGPPRPVSALTDLTGIPAHFVENEVVLKTDDEVALAAFLDRWNGEVVRMLIPADFGLAGSPTYLIRIEPAQADPVEMGQDLQELHPTVRSELRFASESGMYLVAAAARERAEGLPVDLNWVFTPTDIPSGSTNEASTGRDLDGSGPDSYTSDAFQWWPLTSITAGTGPDQIPDWPIYPHHVTRAWQYLNRTGDDTARVRLAVIDGGFMMNDPDMPPDQIALSAIGGNPLGTPNPTLCSGGNPCPWHGTGSVQTAAAVIDNFVGTAGTGGQVVQPITIHSDLSDFGVMIALVMARANGAQVVSMSFSRRIPAAGVIFTETWNDETADAAANGVVLFASAGNSGVNVDAEDCFVFCWEETWHTPCENDGVICVGGLQHGSIYAHSSSNYGHQVDVFAPWTNNSGARPSPGDPTGATGSRFGGTSAATPWAAGVAAMMLAADPTLSPGDVLFDLQATAHDSGHYKVGKRAILASEAVRRAIGDLPPQIQIVAPADGASLSLFDAEFRAEPSDLEGSLLTVTWQSDRQGVLGTGLVAQFPNLLPGTHVITASTTDDAGQTVSAQITIQMFNNPPVLQIIEPLDGQQFVAGETIRFRGTSLDLEHFQDGPLPDSQVGWRFIRLGSPVPRFTSLGAGHEVLGQIPDAGIYRIFFNGEDPEGSLGTDSVEIVVGPTPPDLPPFVTISIPSQDIVIGSPILGVTVIFAGSAIDPEEGTLGGSSMVWTSNIDGLLGTGSAINATLSASPCGPREHIITLRATDSFGNVRSAIRRVSVFRPPC